MFKNFHLSASSFYKMLRLTSLMMLLYFPTVKAQDTIVKRNDEVVIGKILEVNQNEIKYKRFDYQDGPTFTTVKWELRYIIYGNGVKESFENITAPMIAIPEKPKKDLTIQ